MEIETCKAGILPPAFGTASMLKLEGHTRPMKMDCSTNYKLFEQKKTVRAADTHLSRPKQHKKQYTNNNSNDNNHTSDDNDNTVVQFPLLPENNALYTPISGVPVPMDGWHVVAP